MNKIIRNIIYLLYPSENVKICQKIWLEESKLNVFLTQTLSPSSGSNLHRQA